MRNERFRFTRTAWTGAGVLLAGLLTGCQGSGVQVIRGDGTGLPPQASNVNTPAFAQVAAGQNLPTGTNPMVVNRMPTQPLVAGQPVVGSGGAVYPLQGAPHQPMMVAQPQPMLMQPPQQHMMVAQPQPQPQPTMVQGQPYGQPIGIVQTPTGPQYVYAEAPTPGMPVQGAPTSPIVANTPPTTIAPPSGVPSVPTPATNVPSYTAPVGHPTFVAPPPTTIPMPNLHIPNPTMPAGANYAPSETSGARAPEPLPPTVTVKPIGVALPNTQPLNPALGGYPTAPALVPTGGVKLPTPTRAVDDEIPDAPIFPGAK